jgi:hypothetical protein
MREAAVHERELFCRRAGQIYDPASSEWPTIIDHNCCLAPVPQVLYEHSCAEGQ